MIPLLFRVYLNNRKMECNEVDFTLSFYTLSNLIDVFSHFSEVSLWLDVCQFKRKLKEIKICFYSLVLGEECVMHGENVARNIKIIM